MIPKCCFRKRTALHGFSIGLRPCRYMLAPKNCFEGRETTRNEIYARVGRIRTESEKADMQLQLWCLAAKGYTDLEINPTSAKGAWTEAQTIAH